MKNPNIQTEVKHSQSNSAWNVIGTTPGKKYKICRVPYLVCDNLEITKENRVEALRHANFISWCFNNSKTILEAHGYSSTL